MTLGEITRLITGKDPGDNTPVTSLEYSSSECMPGSVFFCFNGIHTSGALHVADAAAHGAVAAVTDSMPEAPVSGIRYIITERNIRSVYAECSSAFFSYPWKKLVMIGVTGTDGKSSTSDFIYQLLTAAGIRCALLTTIYMDDGTGRSFSPYRQSTPEAFLVQGFLSRALSNGCTHAVIECTSHALSAEYDRLAGVSFSYSAFTRISSEHMEFHHTMEAYIGAKLRLAEHTEKGNSFIYRDSRALDYMTKELREHFTLLEKPEITVQKQDGLEYTFSNKLYHFPFAEGYMLENGFEAASLVSKVIGLPIEEVLQTAGQLKHIKGRSEHIPNTIGRNLIIDFAHTPDSFHALFSEYRKIYTDGTFIALFGAAGCRDRSKRAGLGLEAARYCGHIIITEEDPREEKQEDIAQEIIEGIPQALRKRRDILVIDDRKEAISRALALSEAGDTIFFLGKGHETSIDKDGKKIPYSEYMAVEEALRRCSCSCRKQ